jgi:hypothetical protein
MTKTPKTETEIAVEEKTVSTKREITATVVSAAVVVTLGVVANIFASAIGVRINEALTKPKPKTEDE